VLGAIDSSVMSSSNRADDGGGEEAPERLSRSDGDSSLPDQGRSGIFDNGFESYRTVTDDDYRSLFASGLIVLDTNVLLDLYRYHPETRQELLDVLDQLRDRLWVPNQVMVEFWSNRESVLEDASNITGTVVALDKLSEQYMSRVREWTNRAGLREEATDRLVDISKSAFDATIMKIRSLAGDKALKIAEDTARDSVIVRLESILQGRVGNPLSVERKRVAINQEAPQRFADRRPPGYMDANKKNGDPIGDYLIWIETLEEAARLKVDVLFVTGDTKEDWWRQERGQAKGPHPQLAEEMRNVSGVRLFMLRPASFLKHAGELLHVKVSPESVQDAQRVTATADIRWRAANLESEVVAKLREAFGDLNVSSQDHIRTDAGEIFRPDALVRLPDRVPVAFEVKLALNPTAFGSRFSDALRRVEHIARSINGQGVLVLILSEDFSPEDVERWTRQMERRAMEVPSVLIYIARYSDFLEESAKEFAGRVLPPNLPSL
jgi:predicted nucleic acid-binding protein